MTAQLTEAQTEDIAYRLFAAAIPGLSRDDRGMILTLLYGGEWGGVIDSVLAIAEHQPIRLPEDLLAEARSA